MPTASCGSDCPEQPAALPGASVAPRWDVGVTAALFLDCAPSRRGRGGWHTPFPLTALGVGLTSRPGPRGQLPGRLLAFRGSGRRSRIRGEVGRAPSSTGNVRFTARETSPGESCLWLGLPRHVPSCHRTRSPWRGQIGVLASADVCLEVLDKDTQAPPFSGVGVGLPCNWSALGGELPADCSRPSADAAPAWLRQEQSPAARQCSFLCSAQ